MKQQEPTRAALRSHADAAIPRQMWLNPKTELRASHRHGTGLFATQSIEPGEIVEVWGERWD